MTPGEGATQALISALPTAAVFRGKGNDPDFSRNHLYLNPLLNAAKLAGMYVLGSLGMEYLTGIDLSQEFAAVVGGLEGLFAGATSSTITSRRPSR